jgi:hypothetical protein
MGGPFCAMPQHLPAVLLSLLALAPAAVLVLLAAITHTRRSKTRR